jgi:hypothetical protein
VFISHILRVIIEIHCIKFRPEVVLVNRGRGRPEMTPPFHLFRSLLYGFSVDIFCLPLSFEKIFNIIHLAGDPPLRLKFRGLGILNPLAEFGETATPKSDYLTPNRVV